MKRQLEIDRKIASRVFALRASERHSRFDIRELSLEKKGVHAAVQILESLFRLSCERRKGGKRSRKTVFFPSHAGKTIGENSPDGCLVRDMPAGERNAYFPEYLPQPETILGNPKRLSGR